MSDHFTLDDLRAKWRHVMTTIETGTGPVEIRRAYTDTPYLYGLPPTLYDQYQAALGEPTTPDYELTRPDPRSDHVDWDAAGDATRLAMDARAARSNWGRLHFRVVRDGVHVTVLYRYPTPPRRAAVFVPVDYAQRAAEALQQRG